MQKITSSQNPRLKDAIKLHSSRGRNRQTRIIIIGYRETARAVRAGVQIKEVFLCPEYVAGEVKSELGSLLKDNAVSQFELTQTLFEKLTYGNRSDGVVSIADRPAVDLEQFPTNPEGMILIIQSLENPGNLGAIARSADGAGAGGIIVADALTDIFHPNVIRASMGTIFSVPIALTTSEKLQSWLATNQVTTFVANPEATAELFEVDLTGRCAVVFGNEATGVTDEWSSSDYDALKLPMLGLADSLNVSVSASIFVYEALRQRRRSVRRI